MFNIFTFLFLSHDEIWHLNMFWFFFSLSELWTWRFWFKKVIDYFLSLFSYWFSFIISDSNSILSHIFLITFKIFNFRSKNLLFLTSFSISFPQMNFFLKLKDIRQRIWTLIFNSLLISYSILITISFKMNSTRLSRFDRFLIITLNTFLII